MSKYDVTIDRDKYIGGSDVPIIMGLSPFKTRWQLLCEKSGKEENTFSGNQYTEYGHIMEPKIRDYINGELMANFEEGEIIDGDLRYHDDGFDGKISAVLEIKTTSQIHDSIEEYKHYVVQLMLGMAMRGAEKGYLAVYERPEDFSEEFDPRRLTLTMVQTDPELIAEIFDAINNFRADLETLRENPFLDEQDLLPKDVAQYADKIAVIEKELKRIKDMESEAKELKKNLLAAMESRGIKSWTTPNGTKVTYVAGTEGSVKKVIDTEKLLAEHPECSKYEVEKVVSGKSPYLKITPKKVAE